MPDSGSLLAAGCEKAAELAFWMVAIDLVPVENRIEWVAEKMRRYREVSEMRDSYLSSVKPWSCACPPTMCNELPGCPTYARIHRGGPDA